MANKVEIHVDLDERGVGKGLDSLGKKIDKFGKSSEDAGKKGAGGFTIMKGAAAGLAAGGIGMAANALAQFAGDSIAVGQTFESSMSNVAALSGATGDELQALSDKAKELGSTTTFSASEAADALGYMALAGWDTEQSLAAVDSVLTLAQAGNMDLAAASDLVTDYLSAFNMEASQAGEMVDVLAFAQGNANTSTEQLGAAFKNCAANANAAGMDVQTTTAAISMMSNQGLKGAEAGTALNAMMRDMTARMKDGAITIGEASVAVTDAQGNYRDFADILADVEAATNGMGDAEKAAALSSTFTADSIKGMNLLLNSGSGELASFRDELYGCEGAAQDMADTMTDNLAGDVAGMQSGIEGLQIQFFELSEGAMRGAVQFITGSVIPAVSSLMTWMGDNLGPVVQQLGEWVSANVVPALSQLGSFISGTLVPVLAALWGFFAENILPIFQQVAAFVLGTLLPAVLKFASGAVAAVSPIVGKFASVAAGIIRAFGGFVSFVLGIPGKVKGAFDTAVSTITSIPGKIASAFSNIHIKLPHLKVSGKFSIVPPGVPSFSVDWYAKGGVFNSAQVIGIGEAGTEYALREHHLDEIAERMSGKAGGGVVINLNYSAGADANQMVRDIALAMKRQAALEG